MATKIAEVLEVPVAYFFIEDNLMAELVTKLHFLTELQQKEVLDFINQTALDIRKKNI